MTYGQGRVEVKRARYVPDALSIFVSILYFYAVSLCLLAHSSGCRHVPGRVITRGEKS